VTKEPITQPENYRLLVDELPDPKAQRSRVVTFVLRYSIPVFFYPSNAEGAKLVWSIEQNKGKIYVTATNSGDRHARISALKLHEGNEVIAFGSGLTGYVLGRSTMRWAAPGKTHRLNTSNSVAISAQSDHGPINASLPAQTTR
jgi:fimbrial chaperone protein